MTLFEQFIFIYIISATALAGFAVLWRNWLADHASWKTWLQGWFGAATQAFTCGSCFTFWITLLFTLVFDPLRPFMQNAIPNAVAFWPVAYLIQWMSLGWSAVFLRFLYIALQERVNILVHGPSGHGH